MCLIFACVCLPEQDRRSARAMGSSDKDSKMKSDKSEIKQKRCSQSCRLSQRFSNWGPQGSDGGLWNSLKKNCKKIE